MKKIVLKCNHTVILFLLKIIESNKQNFLNNINYFFFSVMHHLPISGRVDKASTAETVDSGSIYSSVQSKTIKVGIHSFLAWRSSVKRMVYSFCRVW